MITQSDVNDHMDDLLAEVLDTLKGHGYVETIAVGVALILIGLHDTPAEEKAIAWKKMQGMLAAATEGDPDLSAH